MGEIAGKKLKVIFVRSNPCSPDPRIDKEASYLVKQGHEVNVLAWDREKSSKNEEFFHGYKINRARIASPYGSFNVFFYLILWNLYELHYLLKTKWAVVHSCGLDTIIPAYILAKVKKKKIVYDIFDFYADSLPLGTPSWLRNIIASIEIYFINRVDKVIIVDKSRFVQIGKRREGVFVIMNSPHDIKIKSSKIKKSEKFIVFFAGVIAKNRSIIEMCKAVDKIPGAQFLLAGFGENTKEMLPEIKKFKNTKFIGKIPYDDVINYSLTSDALFAIYDPRVPNHKFSSANKLFEAMMCKKPLIVARGTSMDVIVEEEQCGLVVEYGNIKDLTEKLSRLKSDRKLAKKLGENGRKAYEKKYNWNIMENRLKKVYRGF